MKKIALSLLALTLGMGCAAKTHRVSIPVALAADVVSTEYSISNGKVEQNPIFKSTASRVAISVAYGAFSIWFVEKLHNHGHHGWAKFFECLVVVPKTGLAIHNIKEARE